MQLPPTCLGSLCSTIAESLECDVDFSWSAWLFTTMEKSERYTIELKITPLYHIDDSDGEAENGEDLSIGEAGFVRVPLAAEVASRSGDVGEVADADSRLDRDRPRLSTAHFLQRCGSPVMNRRRGTGSLMRFPTVRRLP